MNETAPLVSVLIPVFNGQAFVAAAIESVLAQTFEDYEIVIVDDGSTDDTPNIIDRYRGDPRVRPLRLAENRGLVACLNFGLEHCRGELIARLDADDVCRPTRLALQSAAFLHDRSLTLHATSYDRVDFDGTQIRCGRPPLTHAALVGAQLSGNRLSHSTVMFRRDAAIALDAYMAAWFPVEDYDLWLRMCAAGKFAAADSSEVIYLDNPTGISNSLSQQQAGLHVKRSFVEISRLANCTVTATDGPRKTVRAISRGLRHQRKSLQVRGIDTRGLAWATFGSAMRMTSERTRLRRHILILTTAPFLVVAAMWDCYLGHRE